MRSSSLLPYLILCVVPATRQPVTTAVTLPIPAPITLLLPDSGWVTSGDGAGVRILGVPRRSRVTLRARRSVLVSRRIDQKYVTDTLIVSSWATFSGNKSATVDVDHATPVDGSWTSADELGLFWSMRRTSAASHDELLRDRSVIDLVLESNGVQVASGSLRLRPSARAIVRRVVLADRLAGAFAAPAGTVHAPVVIALHGSEGGDTLENLALATRFAARGYAAFAVSYVAYEGASLPGVPTAFDSIDVATLDRARAWVGTQREADTSRTAVWGVSKGGEFAMVAAARRSWPRAVVGCVPSDVMWAGYGREPAPGTVLTSWSDSGQRLPAIQYENYGDVFTGKATARQVHDRSRAAHADQAALARIPIQRTVAALLLLGSDGDDVWNSGGMVRAMAKTRFSDRSRASVEWHVYGDGGHGICGVGTSPAAVFDDAEPPLALGTARAAADAWRRTMVFLRRVLAP